MNLPSSKKYSEKDKQENDPESRRQLAAFFASKFGYTFRVPLEQQEEMYCRGDVLMYDDNGEPVILEAEHKNVWEKHGEWESKSWLSIDVPGRKLKNGAKLFGMFNKHYDTLALTLVATVKKSPVRAKDTIITSGEGFFNVPIKDWTFFRKQHGTWVGFSPDMSLPDVQFEIDN